MIMDKMYLNPSSFEEDTLIEEESKIKFFFDSPLEKKEINIVYHVKENQTLDLTMVDFSSSSFQMNLNVKLERGSKVFLSLASIGFQDTEKVFSFNVEHLYPQSTSRVKMSGINMKNGVLRFLGNSLIVNKAFRSDTRQEGKITNLSFDCKSEVSPSLLIKENDVNASHGAAVGAYNPDELFYLMSRGLSLEESEKLITYGTLLPIIEKLEDEKLIEKVKFSLEVLTL